MMTTHEVQTLLTIGENIVIEFKRAGDGPKWDTYESICAFLNRNGGDVLLLGSDDCIGGLFPAYKTDCLLRRVNMDRYDDRVTVYGNLIEAYDKIEAFGVKHLDNKFFIENGLSVDIRSKILREMIGNTLAHREYTSGLTARFVIERDRMFTENANKAVNMGIITPQNLRPFSKNPIIANFFHQIGRADELGSGVRNLYHYVRIYSGADPVFDEGDIFRLTVPLDDDYSPEKGHLQKRQTIQAGVRQTRQHGGFQECSDALRQTAVADNEPYNDTYKEPDNEPHNGETLTPSERKFLSFVEQAGSLSAAELRTLMCVRNVSDFHARYIRPMLKRGLIEHTLPNAKRSKFQKYRLTRRGHAVVENVLRSRKEVNQ